MNRLSKTEPADFLYCRFSPFLKDLLYFFSDYLEVATAVVVPIFFSFSGSSGILGPDGKQC